MDPEQPHRCNCKVGSCLLCGSACKRCGCACDGVEPGVALAQSTGQRAPKRSSTGSEQREAAKRARIEIAKAREQEEGTIVVEPTIKQVETMDDLWQAFALIDSHGVCWDTIQEPRYMPPPR